MADLPAISARLDSASPDEVREAIDLLSVIDNPAVVPPIAALLRRGQSDAITDRALEALRGLRAASALDVLTEFTHHRRVGARRRAYQAIAVVQDRRVPALLEQGLRDSERGIREACALALGDIGARGSLELLFHAFDRGVIGAAVAIGKLGDGAAIERFNTHLGHAPLSVMLSGYEQFLRRTDVTEDLRIEIVGLLTEHPSRAVRELLLQTLAMYPERDRSRIRAALANSVNRIRPDGTRIDAADAGVPAAPAASPRTPRGGAQ